MVLIIDSRESGQLVEQLSKKFEVRREALGGGDYLIPKQQGFILIERSSFSDFIGKIKSGRLFEQINKCREITDDFYLLVENPYTLKYSKFNRAALWAMLAAVSRSCKLMFSMNQSDSYNFIRYLYEKYNTDRAVSKHETRVKPRNMSIEDQAVYMLMGISKVGEQIATSLLKGRSISDLALMNSSDLRKLVGSKMALRLYEVLHKKL